MYYVPLTPAEIWIGIAMFFIVVVIIAIRKWATEPRRMTDEERHAIEERNRRDWEAWMAKHQKEHPDIWDENGNVR